MITFDLQSDAYDIVGSSDDPYCFRKITDSITALQNKGNWDPLIAYADIPIQNTTASEQFVTLPSEVGSLIRLSVNNRPAMFRDRYFAWAVNSPGDTGVPLQWTFDDQPEVALQKPFTTDQPTQLRVSVPTPAVRVTGIDNATGTRIEGITLEVGYAGPVWREIISVSKDVGEPNTEVTVFGKPQGVEIALAIYEWRDKAPSYRRVKITGGLGATTCRAVFRRKTYEVASWLDYIPLSSKLAVAFMMRALKSYEAGDKNGGDGHKATALEFLTDDHTARESAEQNAKAEGNVPSLTEVNDRFSGIITFAEVYDEAAGIFGGVGREEILDKICQAAEELSLKGDWDSLLGYADVICPTPADLSKPVIVALPRWMDNVLHVRSSDRPLLPRGRWIQFHINGPWRADDVPGYTFDYYDRSPLLFDIVPTAPVALAFIDESNDPTKSGPIHVTGIDAVTGREVTILYAAQPDGGFPGSSYQILGRLDSTGLPVQWKSISRITRQSNRSWCRVHVQVIPIDYPATNTGQLGAEIAEFALGDLETEYRRIRVPVGTPVISVCFRKRQFRPVDLSDPIFLRSKGALEAMMYAIKSANNSDPANYSFHLGRAVDLMEEEQASRGGNETFTIQNSEDLMFAQDFIS